MLLDLPQTPGHAALRAALMALRLPPTPLATQPAERQQWLAKLAAQPDALAFIDISRTPGAPAKGLVDLFVCAPDGPARRRIMLTRMADGHVSEADRRWVRELGFADLLPQPEPEDCEGTLREAADWAARIVGVPALPAADLARFTRVSAQPAAAVTARALIRRHTGLSAEGLATRLTTLLDVQDRRWRLQGFAQCFVGSEAVHSIASGWSCTRADAVTLGQALARLGLLVHVAHEHPFLDDHLFYRLAWSGGEAGERNELGALWNTLSLPGGLEAKTRHYLGKAYADCWVGRQAVDLLCDKHGLDRLAAWLAMHRLMQFGLFEHVTRARPFIDGDFFYRFAATGG
ncbi:MAG: hypothetical protein JNJ89_17530 [Rubrivivax sp.]|nr:hypothetical protein [Rubrivivax sp.]